ncbi:hypothetical protein Pla22_20150 [Rubripirellula amarantea]|uniref:DUF1444 family protein n=1 Tax=Rubripirellula amarantea TaxID=2527999 RepID=A0A5C5WUT2_9BACT|nr:DUF1444 family protein [Rubripirellula amarantea]TWT54368.1 hypothetical protein Pla22_20150 [Rubripirellula amarantea]
MDIDAFTRRVLDSLKKSFPDRLFTLGEELGLIHSGEMQFGMANLYAQYQQSPIADDEFDGMIKAKFAAIFQMVESNLNPIPDAWGDARDRLRLQLVSTRVSTLGHAVTFPFADDVTSSVVIDSPDGYAYVRPEDAERWQQTSVDLIEVAKANLVKASEQLEVSLVPGGVKLLVIQTGDGYDAARILLPEVRKILLDELDDEDVGTVYAGVPNRDFLIAWSMDTPDEIHQQLCSTVAADANRQSHPLSKHVFRLSEEVIVPV